MNKKSILFIFLTVFMAIMMTGCSAVITDDKGEKYEIPLDNAEEMARKYIADQMQNYITEELAKGNSLADILGIDEKDLEQIVREEIKNAIAEEIGEQDIKLSGEDVLGLLMGGDLDSLLQSGDKSSSKKK